MVLPAGGRHGRVAHNLGLILGKRFIQLAARRTSVRVCHRSFRLRRVLRGGFFSDRLPPGLEHEDVPEVVVPVLLAVEMLLPEITNRRGVEETI